MATRKSVGRAGTDQSMRPSAESSADLEALLALASMIDIDDDGAMEDQRQRTMKITAGLAAAGRIPDHLVVAPDDPAVVVVRTIETVSHLAAARCRIPVEAGPFAASVRHRPRPRADRAS